MSRGRARGSELAHLKPASAYLRRFTYDTMSHAPASLAYLIDLVGADRVLLGSDYRFDLGVDRLVETVTRLPGLSRLVQAKILSGNAAKILRPH